MKVDSSINTAANVQAYMKTDKAQAKSSNGKQAQDLKGKQEAANSADVVSISIQGNEAKKQTPVVAKPEDKGAAPEVPNQQEQNARKAENSRRQAATAYTANGNAAKTQNQMSKIAG